MVVAGKHFSHLHCALICSREKWVHELVAIDFFFYESAAEVKRIGGGRFFLDFV